MKYVARIDGVIVSVNNRPQPGFAEEALPADHPDVVAYLTRPVPPGPYEELLDALDEVAGGLPAGGRAKLDALLARRAADKGGAGIT